MSRQGSWQRKLWEDFSGVLDGTTPLTTASNFVETTNSSTTPLDADEVFTGEWYDASAYSDLVVAVSTDQDGQYAIQFSPDGTNIDSTLTRYYRTSVINPPHRFTITRRYFRIVFTNDSVAQTYFRLQVMVGLFSPLNVPIDNTVSPDYDAIVVRPTSFEDEVVLGRRQGVSAFLKFGYNEDVDSGTEVLASFGGTFTPLTTASTFTFVSSSTADTSGGTGARTLLVNYLDSNRDQQQAVVTLNGTSNVVSAFSGLGINRIVVLSSGTGQVNAGNISVTATTGGSNQAYIPAGTSVTQQLIYFNPDNYDAVIKGVSFNVLKLSGGSSPRVTVVLKVFNPKVTQSIYTIRRYKIDTSLENSFVREYVEPIRLDPTDVAWLEVTTDQNNTSIDAEMDIVQYKRPLG